jgi:hypothetical protein
MGLPLKPKKTGAEVMKEVDIMSILAKAMHVKHSTTLNKILLIYALVAH